MLIRACVSAAPFVAARFGWRGVNRVMGGGGLLLAACWFAFARSKPTQYRRRGDPPGAALVPAAVAAPLAGRNDGAASAAGKKQAAGRSSRLALFTHPAVLSTIWSDSARTACRASALRHLCGSLPPADLVTWPATTGAKWRRGMQTTRSVSGCRPTSCRSVLARMPDHPEPLGRGCS